MNTKQLPAIIGEAFLEAIRQAVREEIAVLVGNSAKASESGERAFLTVMQAAEISGLGASTVRLAIRRRQLRAQRVGRRVLVKRSDLERFLEANPIETKQG